MLTISIGFFWHVYRVCFGDELTLRYVVTPTVDKVLLVPMTYAGITGILLLVNHRVRFANKPHRALFTASVVYIAASVPLHIYFGVIKDNVDFYLSFFPVWFSFLLLIVVYPAFLTMLAKLHYRN